jgi:hypothetical protein
MPDHIHVPFLPAFSPGLQPAEPLWPLNNAALANRHCATVKALEMRRGSDR